jgi:hypothetical protein
MSQQVKSKKRVQDHGEVFTAEREVNAMLDLVKHETERVDSRFLEPACGNGNFLAEILNRKLTVVTSRYKSNAFDWEHYAIIAVSSIYGIDIQEDNVIECRERLYNLFSEKYTQLFKKEVKSDCLRSVKFLLERNILWADALDLKNPVTHEPIIFSEWTAINETQLKRRDFKLDMLLRQTQAPENSLFSDLGEEAFLPTPIQEFPLIHFLKLGEDA